MILSKPFVERRKDPRLNNNVPLKISGDSGEIVTESGNISRSGVYCKVNTYIDPMTKLKICLLLPMQRNGKSVIKKIVCRGVVVRTEPSIGEGEYNIAIFFNDIAHKDAEYIADYVNFHLEKQKRM